jgi:hypothetical protein
VLHASLLWQIPQSFHNRNYKDRAKPTQSPLRSTIRVSGEVFQPFSEMVASEAVRAAFPALLPPLHISLHQSLSRSSSTSSYSALPLRDKLSTASFLVPGACFNSCRPTILLHGSSGRRAHLNKIPSQTKHPFAFHRRSRYSNSVNPSGRATLSRSSSSSSSSSASEK